MIFRTVREWWERRQALREISVHLRIEREGNVMRFRDILERAESAIAADQHPSAVRLCQEIQERFFREAVGSERLFNVVMSLRLYEDAERLMREGLARHPRESFFLIGSARVAEERGDNKTALRRWAIVRQKFPLLAVGYARTAACLVKEGKIKEADSMLVRGIKQSPADVFCLMEHAKLAEASGDFETALVRWKYMRDVQPDPNHPCYQNGTISLGICLRRMGRLDEAETILQQFVDRFGVQEATIMELARVAEDREDWPEALTRWQQIRRRFPMLAEGYRGEIRALGKCGRADATDAIRFELMTRFNEELGFALDYARSAYEGGDKSEIARRWEIVRQNFPDYEAAYSNGVEALTALGQEAAAAALRAEQSIRFPA